LADHSSDIQTRHYTLGLAMKNAARSGGMFIDSNAL